MYPIMCAYRYIDRCSYVLMCECNEMTAIIQGTREGSYGCFVIIRYSHYLWSSIVLFENGLELVVSVCYIQTLGQSTKKMFSEKYNWYTKKGEKIESYKMLN